MQIFKFLSVVMSFRATHNLFTLINKHLQRKVPIHEADQTLQQLDKVATSHSLVYVHNYKQLCLLYRYRCSLRTWLKLLMTFSGVNQPLYQTCSYWQCKSSACMYVYLKYVYLQNVYAKSIIILLYCKANNK